MPSISTRARLGAAAVVAVVCAFLAYGSPMGSSYLGLMPCHPSLCDDAGPAVAALSEGDVHGFFAQQPPMGSFSVLVRAPFAAAARAAGGHDLAIYRAGAFACLLALGLLAAWTALMLLRRGRSTGFALVVGAAVLVNPVTFSALELGHPEELLAGALCVAAVIAAGRGRALGAGLLLAAALATKQWALLAVPVVVLAAPRSRGRLLGFAGGGAAVLTVPMLLADPSRFWLAQKSVGFGATVHGSVSASNVWFPFADGSTAETLTSRGVQLMTQFSLPSFVAPLAQSLVIVLALGAAAAYARGRRAVEPEEALQLLALVLLVRCILDPTAHSFQHAPFLVALVVYEALRRRVPVMSGFAIAALLLMTHVVVRTHDDALVNGFYLAWSLPLAAALAFATLAPRRLEALAAGLRAPSAQPTQGASS